MSRAVAAGSRVAGAAATLPPCMRPNKEHNQRNRMFKKRAETA
jgi:hypothetical protein